MSTLTIRLPDDTHERLRSMASDRGISVNKLMEELSTLALTQYDTETRFRAAATAGSRARGLEILSELDTCYAPEDRQA